MNPNAASIDISPVNTVTQPSDHWYVIHTKPRQEQRALLNLEQQGYICYLPMFASEKLRRGRLSVVTEPLFPRYLFIQLDNNPAAKGWGQIRSTRGVSGLVVFGTQQARVDAQLITALRDNAAGIGQTPQRLFKPGERLEISTGPFAGIEAVYQMPRGEDRAIVLITLMGKATALDISPANLLKTMGSS